MKTGTTITLFVALFISTIVLQVSGQSTYEARLSGSSEVHLPSTIASGTIEAVLDDTTLVVTGSFSNLGSPLAVDIGGGAHIHVGYAGENGPVVFPLDVTLDGDMLGGTIEGENNTFELNEDQIADLEARRYYVNIHSETYPAGEIRGQLVPAADAVFRVNLTGNNETPPILTQAYGSLVVELTGNEIILTGAFDNLSDTYTASHIHVGLAGEAGGVEVGLNSTLHDDELGGVYEADNNTYTLTEDQIDMLHERRLYVNVHSQTFPPGEIRGQILPLSDALFQANLSGATETPPVDTDATGAVIAELNGNELILTGAFAGLTSPLAVNIGGGAHIHIGYAGESGGVVIPLDVTLGDDEMSGTFEADDNTYELDEEQIQNLVARNYYVNIHSENYGPGEIRGQLLGEAQSYFVANLDGLNEVINGSPVITSSFGGIAVEQTGDRIILSGSFSDLSSDLAVDIGGGAHIHTGAPGATGPVTIPLDVSLGDDNRNGIFEPSNNTFEIDSVGLVNLHAGNLYVNIHSENFGPGEIRGQLLTDPHYFPTVSEITAPGDGDVVIVEGDPDDLIQIEWSEATDPNDNNVVYIWQAALDDDFDLLLINLNVGTDAMVAFSVGAIDSVLASSGVGEGDTVGVYHRAISSNGSLNTHGPAVTASFVRGVVTSVGEDRKTVPDKITLYQNYPNPFNPSTIISFDVPEQETVTLKVFDMLGREVATLIEAEHFQAGSYQVEFNAANLSSGYYFYRLITESSTLTKSMMFIK